MEEYMEGKELYEQELAERPQYHNGWPRPTWDMLTDAMRIAWQRMAEGKEDDGA